MDLVMTEIKFFQIPDLLQSTLFNFLVIHLRLSGGVSAALWWKHIETATDLII